MCYSVFYLVFVEDVTSKYHSLTDHLRRSGAPAVPMTFADVERVIGAKLPRSAAERAWWSNNPANNVMTRAWRAAGYESTRVDMRNRTLVFRRVRPRGAEDGHDGGGGTGGAGGGAPVSGGTTARTDAAGQPAPERGGGPGPDEDGAPRGAGGPDWFAAFYGGLRGTVTIAPGADLTAPAGEEWNAERDR